MCIYIELHKHLIPREDISIYMYTHVFLHTCLKNAGGLIGSFMIGVYWKYWKIIGTNCYSPTVGTWWVPGKKGSPGHRRYLLGGDWNMAGLWLSIWEWLGMSFYPNCYSLRFFRGVGWNHQPVIYFVSLVFFWLFRSFVCAKLLHKPTTPRRPVDSADIDV